ncbi:rhodanese-like domain-containing protein [Ferrimonas sp. YFM]|uniref:sulfurtransferase n=1 Tax=Ferrimonas sp. YFM TaxID=3028878 RepID=UPI0025740DF1|nr:rhodanese-like domain-containing protein [Ferrimonas sp. YFM]BDY04417.1 sulfurtransferase [Ferrimonas sp. YFM]
MVWYRFSHRLLVSLMLVWVTCSVEAATALDPQTLSLWQRQGIPVQLLDARPHQAYLQGHRQGAISFDVEETYRQDQGVWLAKSISAMTQEIRQRGLALGQTIVVYDDGLLMDAARLAWVLELYGLTQVHILVDSLESAKLNKEPVTPRPSSYVPALNPDVLINARMTLLAGHNPSFGIVDIRGEDHYLGKASETKKFGHIPGAINIPMDNFFYRDDNNTPQLRSWGELMSLFQGLDPGKRYITYCYKGKASTLGYFLMQQAGLQVTHYDGSWLDWSQRDMPVERPE